MKSIVFATGNERKVREARQSLADFSIEVIINPVEADEIQHHDPAEITKAKVRAAYDILKRPVVVQDTTWSIPSLGGFPGGYMKDVSHWWRAEDWMTIMKPYADRSIMCFENIAFYDGITLKYFQSQYEGVFVDSPRGENGNSIEKTVTLQHNKTMAELHDVGKAGSANDTLPHWKQFGEWYQPYEAQKAS